MKKNIEIKKDPGIQCDNPKCDFRDNTVKLDELEKWLNKPCPKCGENLLTEEDFLNGVAIRKSINFINDLTKEELKEFSNHSTMKDLIGCMGLSETSNIEMSINTHDEINIKFQEKKKNKKD